MDKADKPASEPENNKRQPPRLFGRFTRIWHYFKEFASFVKWLRTNRKKVILIGIFTLGLGLVLGAPFRLRSGELVIVLVIAGALMAFAYIRMAFVSAVEGAVKVQESDELAEKTEQLQVELNRLKGELEQERRKQVKVLNVQPILKIGFLEAECEVTKFFDCYFDKDNREIREGVPGQQDTTQQKKAKRFLGAVSAKFKAQYGIDVRKVSVKRDDRAKTVYAAGAEPSFVGVLGYPQTRWEGSVGLRYSWGAWSIDEDSQKLESECKEKYRVLFEKTLRNGPEQLSWVREPLRKTVRQFLLMMVAPKGYRVELVDTVGEGFVPLFKHMRDLGLDGPPQLLPP